MNDFFINLTPSCTSRSLADAHASCEVLVPITPHFQASVPTLKMGHGNSSHLIQMWSQMIQQWMLWHGSERGLNKRQLSCRHLHRHGHSVRFPDYWTYSQTFLTLSAMTIPAIYQMVPTLFPSGVGLSCLFVPGAVDIGTSLVS